MLFRSNQTKGQTLTQTFISEGADIIFPVAGGTGLGVDDPQLALVGAGGFAYEEAAEICQCAVGTVKSRVSRARRALHEIMETGRYDRDGSPAGEAMRTILGEAERLSTVR